MISFIHTSLVRNFGCATYTLGSFWHVQVFALQFLVFPALLQANPIRVIDEVAIPFTGFLDKADFDRRYPGELFDDLNGLDTGWYVIYEHESLNYYFGPILLESIGKDYFEQLFNIVQVAVKQRPSIQDYRLELSYEPSPSNFESNTTDPPAQNTQRQHTLPKLSIWGFVKKVFGYR